MRTTLPGRALAGLLLAIVTLAGSLAPAAGKNDNDRAREIWMAGYLKFEEANKAEGENKLMLALDLYREALAAFTEVKSKFPTWNPSLLDYRTNFCKERCRRLEASVTAKNVDLSKTDLVALSKTQEDKIKVMSQETLDLKRKVDLTAKSLEQARSEAARKAAADTDLDKLVRENKALQDAQGAAAERERQLRADLDALKSQSGIKKKAEELQQKLNVALTQQAKLEQETDSYRNALRGLKEQLKEAAANRDSNAEDVRRLKAAAAQDKELADQREARLKDTDAQLAAANQAQAELKLKCGTLETQTGSAADQTRKLQEEVATLRPFRDQLLKATGENQELTAKLTAQAGELTAAKQDAGKVSGLQELVKRLQQENGNIAVLQEQKTQLQQEAEKVPALEDQVARLKKDAGTVPALQEQLTQLKQEVAKVPALREQLARFQQEAAKLPALEDQVKRLKPDADGLPALRDELTAAKAEAVKLKTTVGDLTAARAEAATLTTAGKALRDQVNGLTTDVAKWKEDATTATQEKTKAEARTAELDTLARQRATRIQELEQQTTAADKQVADANARVDAVSARLKTGEEELADLRPLRDKIRTVEAEKQATAGKLAAQAEDLTTAQRTLAQVTAQIKDRETRIRALEAATKGSQLERDTVQARRLQDAEARIADLEKQVQGGGNNAAELRTQLAETKNRLEAAQTQIQPLTEELTALRPLRDRVRQATLDKEDLTGKLAAQYQELATLRLLRDRVREIETEKQDLTAKLTGLQPLSKSMQAMETEKQDLTRKLTTQTQELQELRPLRDRIRQADSDKQELADKYAAQTRQLDALKTNSTQSATAAAERERRVKELEQNVGKLEAAATEREKRVRDLEANTARLETLTREPPKPAEIAVKPVPVEETELYRTVLARATTLERQMNDTRTKAEESGRRADAAVQQAEKSAQTAAALAQEKTLNEQALTTARAKLADLAKIEELLKGREAELTQAQEKNTTATTELNRRELLATTATQRVAELERQTERANQMLDALQVRNKTITEELNGLKQDRGRRDQAVTGLEDKLAAAEKARTEIDQARNDLAKQHDAAVALGRRQEERLAELEKSVATHRQSLADREGKLTETVRELQELKDKGAVFEGLKTSLTESEAAQNTAQNRLKTLEKQVAVLEVQTREKEQESKRLGQELAKERLNKTPENSPLLEQLRGLNRELDQEKEKTKAMEQTLASYQAQVQTTPVAQTGGKERPDSDRVILARGFLQMATGAEKQGRKEAAVWNYRKALEYQPDSKLAFKRLGIIASQDGNEEDAESYLKRAFYADPDDVDVLLPLGFSLVRQGKADLAVSMLARAAALHPEDANIHRTYGVACSSLGWTDAAETQLRRALELNPKDGEAAFNLAILLVSRKPPQTAEGSSWYRKARALGVAADPGLDRVFAQPAEKPE